MLKIIASLRNMKRINFSSNSQIEKDRIIEKRLNFLSEAFRAIVANQDIQKMNIVQTKEIDIENLPRPVLMQLDADIAKKIDKKMESISE